MSATKPMPTGFLPFDQKPSPIPPSNGSLTSNAAARRVAPFVCGMRKRVLDFIASCGENGCTDWEGQQATGIRGDTWRPRRGELADAGYVFKTDEVRADYSVWRAKA